MTRRAFNKIEAGLKEAIEVAKGNIKPARVTVVTGLDEAIELAKGDISRVSVYRTELPIADTSDPPFKLPPENKYGAKQTTVDGIRFHSKAEARRYSELKLLERAGEIRNLERQVPFDITWNGVHICNYLADFVYFEDGKRICEDVKGHPTRDYKLKKKLMLATYGITVVEIKP